MYKRQDTQTEVYSGVEFVEGKIGDQYVVAAKCGIGKVFAAICAEADVYKRQVFVPFTTCHAIC